MIDQFPKDLLQFIGLGVTLVIGISIIESVKIVVRKFWRNGNGNRRREDNDWPIILIGLLEKNGNELKTIAHDIFKIRNAMENGLRANISEVKTIVAKCHELNLIKEYESRKKSQ